jgi:hypothetical protein
MKTKRKVLAILVALVMITLIPAMAFADSPEDYNAYSVKLTPSDTVSPGKDITFSVNIKNNKSEKVTLKIFNWYYRETYNSETYPGVEFGTISGSGYDQETGSISLEANGELNLTLTGTIPDTWSDKSRILDVLTSQSYDFMGQGGYPEEEEEQGGYPEEQEQQVNYPGQNEEAGKAAAEAAAADAAEWNGTLGAIPVVKSVSVKASKKSVKVTWKKANKKNAKKFDKVEIQVCPDKNFARANTKRVFVKKSAKAKTVKGLKKKTTYYVRVRDVKGNGTNKIVSKWSKLKKIKTK